MTKDAVDKAKLLVTTKDRSLAENKDQYQLFIDKFNKSQKVHNRRYRSDKNNISKIKIFFKNSNCSTLWDHYSNKHRRLRLIGSHFRGFKEQNYSLVCGIFGQNTLDLK